MSKNLRQPQSQIKVDGTQIRDSTSREQLKHKIQIDLNGKKLKSNCATISQENESGNKQTFFSRVMNETFGIISTKKISQKLSQASIDPQDLLNLRAVYYGSPSKKKGLQSNSSQVKIEQSFSLDQQIEMLQTFLIENQATTPLKTPLRKDGELSDSLQALNSMAEQVKQIIIQQTTPEKLQRNQAPQIKKNSKSHSNVRQKWDRKSALIQSKSDHSGLMIDSTRQQPDMLIKTNDSHSQIAFQTKEIDEITNLELKSGPTYLHANQHAFESKKESLRYQHRDKISQKQLRLRGIGATKIGMRSLQNNGNFQNDPDIEDRVETLETQTGGRSSRNQNINSASHLKLHIASQRRTIQESTKSIQTRDNSDLKSQAITPDLTQGAFHKKLAGGSFLTNFDNSKTYLGYDHSFRQKNIQNINKKAFAFFKTFEDTTPNPRSEENRRYTKSKPISIQNVTAFTKKIQPNFVTIHQNDQRLNSAEGFNRSSSLQQQFECYRDINDGRLSVKSFLKHANQEFKHMSDSESALAVCLKMQQRGQVPIKALNDMTIFKKKDWRDDHKARMQRPDSKESTRANQAFVRSLYSNLGPSFFIERKLPAKRPSKTLDHTEPALRETISSLNQDKPNQKETCAGTPLSEIFKQKQAKFPKSNAMLKSVDANHNIQDLLEGIERPVQSAVSTRQEKLFEEINQEIERKKAHFVREVQATPLDVRRVNISQVNEMIERLQQDLNELDRQQNYQMRLIIGLDQPPQLSSAQTPSQFSNSIVRQSQNSKESSRKASIKMDNNQLAVQPLVQSVKAVSADIQPSLKEKKKPKTASDFRTEIINSLEYRVAKKVPTDLKQSCLPEYLNEDIEEMCRENHTDRKGAISDPFFIIKKPLKSRTMDQQMSVAKFLKTLYFYNMQIEQLIYVAKKLIPELFMAGQQIIDTFKPGQKVATIIVSGSVTVITQGYSEYCTNGPVMFGKFSQNREEEPRVELRCISTCRVLFLYEQDFDSASYQYLQQKRSQALFLINKVPVLSSWNILRQTALSDQTYYMTIKEGSIIYNLNEKVNNVFFVKEGIVQLEIFFEVKHFSCAPSPKQPKKNERDSSPKYQKLYERLTNTQLVKKVIKIVNAGEVFGFEEIITSFPIRVIRAKALRPLVMFACSKQDFLSRLDRRDVRKLIESCKHYTDFKKCGVELANQMRQLRRKTECLLDATQSNEQYLLQKNFRSQDTLYTWLGLSQFGTKPQKRLKLMQKYLTGIKERAQTLVQGELNEVKGTNNEQRQNESDSKMIKEVGQNLVKQLVSNLRSYALSRKPSQEDAKKPEIFSNKNHPKLEDQNFTFGFKIIAVKTVTEEFEDSVMRTIWQQREQLVRERRDALREEQNQLIAKKDPKLLDKELQAQEEDILYERKNNYLHSIPCVEELNLVVTHTIKLTLE